MMVFYLILFPFYFVDANSNTIELTVHTSRYCVLDLLCVNLDINVLTWTFMCKRSCVNGGSLRERRYSSNTYRNHRLLRFLCSPKSAPINERQKMNVKYLGPKLKLEKLVKHKSTVEGGGGRLKFNFWSDGSFSISKRHT